MRRWVAASIVVVGIVAVVGGAIAVHAQPPKASRGRELHFAVQFSPLFLLDLGSKGLSRGDEIVSHDRLFNGRGVEVGHDGIACTITDPSVPEAACQGTFSLPRGDISVQLLNSPPPRKVGSITGGTGVFSRARGKFVLVESPTDQSGSVTFLLSP